MSALAVLPEAGAGAPGLRVKRRMQNISDFYTDHTEITLVWTYWVKESTLFKLFTCVLHLKNVATGSVLCIHVARWHLYGAPCVAPECLSRD